MSAMKPNRTPYRKFKAGKHADGETSQIKVFCRLRPTELDSNCITIIDGSTLQARPPFNSLCSKSVSNKSMQYNFSRIFDESSSQDDIFESVGLDLVKEVLSGRNALLFSYGVTGSGKTHSMIGDKQDPGIIVRSLDVIYNSIDDDILNKQFKLKPDNMNGYLVLSDDEVMSEVQRNSVKSAPVSLKRRHIKDNRKIRLDNKNINYSFFISYYEIYNNCVFDLLHVSNSSANIHDNRAAVKILREDKNGAMYPANLVEIECRTSDEAYNVLLTGKKRRHIASTLLNNSSSRSHAIFNIRVVQTPMKDFQFGDTDAEYISSQYSIVDLAGCERSNRTHNLGERMLETGNINNSLMTLRSCIEMLRENANLLKKKVVPYRNCKLTHLFKSNFEQPGNIRIMVCVNPANVEFDETLNVCRFAESSREIELLSAPRMPTSKKRNVREYDESSDNYNDANNQEWEIINTEIVRIKENLPSYEPIIQVIHENNCFDFNIDEISSIIHKRAKKRRKVTSSFLKASNHIEQILVKDVVDEKQLYLDIKDQFDILNEKYSKVISDKASLKSQVLEAKQEAETFKKMKNRHEEKLENEYTDKFKRMKSHFEMKIDSEKKNLRRSKKFNEEMAEKIINLEQVLDSDSTFKTPRMKTRACNAKYGSDLSLTSTDTGVDSARIRVLPSKAVFSKTPKCTKLTGDITRKRNVVNGGNTTRLNTPRATPRTAKNTPYNNFKTPIGKSVAKKVYKPTFGSSNVKTKVKKYGNIVNLPSKRRSKSADLWIDHHDAEFVDNKESVLQPVMRKSITRINVTVKDTHKASKYLLTHQDLEDNGNVSKKIITGDIKTTQSGGSSVIFNKVESIKSSQPGSTHIRKDGDLHPQDFDGQWTDTEDRCHIAVEGHDML